MRAGCRGFYDCLSPDAYSDVYAYTRRLALYEVVDQGTITAPFLRILHLKANESQSTAIVPCQGDTATAKGELPLGL